MSSAKSLLVIALLGILGAVIYFHLFRNYAPQASVDFEQNRQQIIDLARDYLEQAGYDNKQFTADANFRFDSGIAIYLQHRFGLVRAHNILRADTLSTHNWEIYFFDKSLTRNQMRDQFYVWISPTGRFLGFRHELSDSVALPSLTEVLAQQKAEEFLQGQGLNLNRYSLENSTANQLANRKDYFFRWTKTDSVLGMAPKVWVRVQGDKIGGFRYDLTEPEAFQRVASQASTIVTFIITASSILTFVLVIFIITLFLKKYHEGEVGIKTAVSVFAFLFALILAEHILGFTHSGYGTIVGDVNRFNVRIVVFIITVFIVQAFLAAMVFAAWSVGESSARRGWNKIMKAIDGLLHQKPFTLDLAHSVVRGYAYGFILLGLIFGATMLISGKVNFGIYTLSLFGIPESFFPSLSAVLLALRLALLNEIVFRFFFISWLREKSGKLWPGMLISSLLWTLAAFTLWDFPLGYVRFVWLFPAYFLISMILGWIMIRHDLLTAIFANFVMLGFSYAIPILVSPAAYFEIQSGFFYVFMAVPLLMAGVGFVKRQRFQFSLELTPAHIRRISERERMSQELEIARNVQMSLLPKQNPLVEGYDIAGVCIPALEVGGDYYDFFQLGDGKIGIAIGDVSGKGVPAAIYMTLTKGILQSYASVSMSPREVLHKLNQQMYLNIERNSFVSMFYAVLDMQTNTIRFARAGHNPAILAHRSKDINTLLEPKGIALGLEGGQRFYNFLEEHEIRLESGDVLTFYTDGFTEASTKTGDEYGEDRLEKIISQNKNDSANSIIQTVVRSVKKFVGSHPQHDDMTMVVVKAL